MLILLLAGALAGQVEATATWTPPEQVDAHRVLHEATRDAREGKHEIALAKFLWFHHNALKHDQSLAAVRLSFALSYWLDLARKYLPAREALKKARDGALREFERHQRGRAAFQAFHEFESINEKLGEGSLTAKVFEELDEDDPAAAEPVFALARPALVRAKNYRLCGKYLRAEDEWLSAARLYELGRHHAGRYGPEHLRYVEKSFTSRVATLVALLVVNARPREAEQIAHQARGEWESADFHAAIDAALRGDVPEPWP